MIGPVMSIVVASTNRGKLAEIRALLAHLPVEVMSMEQALGEELVVQETGSTFEENALLKARQVADRCMMVTLADDSGLEVDALNGRPGVRSARFAGEGATDAENNALLLRSLEDLEPTDRTARFRCVLALVDPWAPEEELLYEGRCEGSIAHKATGAGGFGYDPLFVVKGDTRTMAELSDEEKNSISHRGEALKKVAPHLIDIVRTRLKRATRLMKPSDPPTEI